MVTSRTLLVGGIVAALSLTACGDTEGPTAAPTTAAPSATPSVMTLAKPTGPTVLTISGGGVATPVVVDFAALDAVATRSYDVFEPFDKKRMTFTGVELSAVLDAAGVPPSTTKVRLTALDDYLVDLQMSDIRKGGVILATRAGGAPMAIPAGGPIRIVFTDDVKIGKNTDRWIWSLNKVEVS